MKKSADTRFCDALRNVESRIGVSELFHTLVIGPGTTDPLDCILYILRSSKVLCIEIDERAYSKLQAQWQNDDIQILHGDASQLSVIAPGSYHLVIVRHPDIERHTERWTATFAAVSANMLIGGFLIVSAYSLAEVSMLQECLSSVGLFLRHCPNITTRPVDLNGSDRYLLLAQNTRAI